MPKTLKEATIIELKAEAFDANIRIARDTDYLRAINQELASRVAPSSMTATQAGIPVTPETNENKPEATEAN
jgi:hypothetical protein